MGEIGTMHRLGYSWRQRLLVAAPFIAAIGLAFVTPDDDRPTVCPFANITGMACPGCGMTRAAGFLVRGDLSSALSYHPLVVMVAIQALAGWVWLLLRSKGRVEPLSQRLVSAILVGSGVSLLVVWALRIWTGSLPPV